MHRGRDALLIDVARVGSDGRHARPDPITLPDGRLADQHTRDVGDGVPWTGLEDAHVHTDVPSAGALVILAEQGDG